MHRLISRSPRFLSSSASASALSRRAFASKPASSSTPSSTVSTATSTPQMTKFLGAKSLLTQELKFSLSTPVVPMPCYRVMDEKGKILIPNYKIDLTNEQLKSMYMTMINQNVMDSIFYDAQRQGRISFYMTNFGEEAAQIGSAAALKPEDTIFAQYRELGVLMWRAQQADSNWNLEQFAHQNFSNGLDYGKGRQMPVHYGSRKLNFQTISSPLGTQLPQAAGAAYALKREGKGAVVICYFGEGAASEGDFHPALNMSATLSCPVIFFCRNNGYAISTPTHEQYRGDGIASRGAGYGMNTIRVDGNDIFAVYEVTKRARELASTTNVPILIESMSYRAGHHSTSDDSTRYRSSEEINYWHENDNPMTRLRLYLESNGVWDSTQEANAWKSSRKELLRCMKLAEQTKKPAFSQLFTDVYKEIPLHLQEQQKELMEHLEKYGDKYGLDEYMKENDYKDPSPAEELENK